VQLKDIPTPKNTSGLIPDKYVATESALRRA